MYKSFLSLTIVAAAAVAPAGAQIYQRRATVIGNGNPGVGKCTISAVVDGAAEIEIRGDNASLRNLSGQAPQWRRFECTGRIPDNPASLRFQPEQGRGSQQLLSDARNGGPVVMRIEDPEGGADVYTFDLFWNGGSAQNSNPAYNGRWQRGYGDSREQAANLCRSEVRERANRRFGSDVNFRNTKVPDPDGDYVTGTIETTGRYGRGDLYQFSCSMDMADGRVRSVQIDPAYRDRSEGQYDSADRGAISDNDAVNLCRDAVSSRVAQDGYRNVELRSVQVHDESRWNGLVTGTARGNRGGGSAWYDFSCRVNMNTGSVRSADVTRRSY